MESKVHKVKFPKQNKRLTLRLSKEENKKLQKYAKNNNITVNKSIRIALAQFFK